MEQLKNFNPGLELNALTVGREIQIAKSISPERQYVINRLAANRRQEADRRRREAARWKTFGYRQYLWDGWRQASGDIRITTVRRTSTSTKYQVAVTCSGLRVSHKFKGTGWSKWKMPNAGEERMLIELCSQIPGAPRAALPRPSGS